MRIALNTRFLLPNRQLEGIGWFSYEVAKRWVQWFPEVEFIFIFDRKPDEQYLFAQNVIPAVGFPPARHPFLFYGFFEWSVPRLLRQHQADVLVSFDGFLSLSANIPTLLVSHDIAYVHFSEGIRWLARKYYQYYVPKFLQKAARIATVSEFSKQDLIQSLQIPADKIDVVYNGANEQFVPATDIEKQEIRARYTQGQAYFLYIGSIHPRKNVARLIQAFDIFKKSTTSPLKLVLAGRMAWQIAEVETALAQAEYKNDIIQLGYVPTEDLAGLMASAFALTYVSLFEGFGIPLLEAMYCEVPCITSNLSSMPEVVGNSGLLVNPYEPNSIAQAMLELWQNADRYSDLVQKAKVQQQQFSWDKTAQRLWESLGHLLPNTQ